MKPSTKRAFTGLAGSPLAEVIPFPEPQQSEPKPEPAPVPAPKRGRPRKHANNAAKQKAHRERKASEKLSKILHQIKVYTGGDGAMFMTDAPHGMGKLITGDYNWEKIEKVTAAHDRDEKGKRVHPTGHAIDKDEEDPTSGEEPRGEKIEYEDTFQFKKKYRFPKHDKLTEQEKDEILDDLIQENTEGEPERADGWDENCVVHINPSTLRCLLCDQPILAKTSVWTAAAPHFLAHHKKLVWQAWRACSPQSAPKSKPHLRNTKPKNRNQNQINELTKKINFSPMRGGVHISPSPEDPPVDQDTPDILNKEVACPRR